MSSSGDMRPEPPAVGTGRARPVVLIVDDDVDALEALSQVLEEADYDVVRAANGLEALGQLGDRGGRCDLILLDLMMPVMNGWQFREQQAKDPELSSIPVVVITANRDTRGIEADETLYKPVNPDHLVEVVERCCAPDEPALSVAPSLSVGAHKPSVARMPC